MRKLVISYVKGVTLIQDYEYWFDADEALSVYRKLQRMYGADTKPVYSERAMWVEAEDRNGNLKWDLYFSEGYSANALRYIQDMAGIM